MIMIYARWSLAQRRLLRVPCPHYSLTILFNSMKNCEVHFYKKFIYLYKRALTNLIGWSRYLYVCKYTGIHHMNRTLTPRSHWCTPLCHSSQGLLQKVVVLVEFFFKNTFSHVSIFESVIYLLYKYERWYYYLFILLY